MLLYTHLVWGIAFKEFFGSDGWNDVDVLLAIREGGGVPSFWWYVPETWSGPVHWSCHAIIVCFILGLGGRLTAIATWVIAVSYANRSGLANFGLDQINCILTLYLTIGPTTYYFSLDRWIHKRLLKQQNWGKRPSATANVAIRLIQIHLCIVYLWAGLGKLQGEAWWNGQAVWLALANREYQSIDMTWLAPFPRLLEVLTHFTVAWELSFIALVWCRPIRCLVLLAGVGMHLGIGAFLGMWTFGLIMPFAYVVFVPTEVLRRFLPPSLVPSQESTQPDYDSFEIARQEAPLAKPRTSPNSVAILVTDCPDCIQYWMLMNSLSQSEWIVVPNRHEARRLSMLLSNSICIQLSMKQLRDMPDIRYLSIRPLRYEAQPNSQKSELTKVIAK